MDLLIHVVSITEFQSTAREKGKHSGDYFTLLRHLLNYAFNNNINVPNAEVLLNNEIDWLKRIRVSYSVYCCCLIAKLYLDSWDPMDCVALQAPLSLGFLSQNTGLDCHFFLQGMFPTQGLSAWLMHCRRIVYH